MEFYSQTVTSECLCFSETAHPIPASHQCSELLQSQDSMTPQHSTPLHSTPHRIVPDIDMQLMPHRSMTRSVFATACSMARRKKPIQIQIAIWLILGEATRAQHRQPV